MTYVVLALVVALGLSFAWSFRRLLAPAADLSRLAEFSVEAYRPMERLLLEDDIHFLRRQIGFEPHMEKRLRVDRRRVFRAYLRNLTADFRLLHRAARILVSQHPEDRPDLAAGLVRQQLLFWWRLAGVHTRLCLNAVPGLHLQVDAGRLFQPVEWFHLQLNASAATAAA